MSVFSWRKASSTRGCELVLRIRGGGVADHAFFVGQLLVQQQRVFPVKLRGLGHDLSPDSCVIQA